MATPARDGAHDLLDNAHGALRAPVVVHAGSQSAAALLDAPASPLDSLAPGAPGWHEHIYAHARAARHAEEIPWANLEPSPLLIDWLNTRCAGCLRPGARVAVVGCGLGDDVAELRARGFEAIGFDISPTAIEWARERFPDHETSFTVCDVLSPSARLLRRHELVVEVNTIQSMDPSLRRRAVAGIASLAHPRGRVLVICREKGEDAGDDGPPWALEPAELISLMRERGLELAGDVESIEAPAASRHPGGMRLRAVFAGAGAE